MIVRLPPQAGKVSKVVTTNLVAKTPSWIAKGDKYFSLCVPSRRMVACSPIMPAGAMKDIEVGARVGIKGEPILTFKIAPGTKMAPKRLQYIIGHFLVRTKKQAAHFNRMAISYAPRPAETSLRIGATSSLVVVSDGGGTTCSYDDNGSYDCTGGSSGGGGGGGGGGDQCQDNCEFPSGNDNGDIDPCIDASGTPTCPVIEITGHRPTPEETETVGCRPVNPWTVECGRIPPVIGGEPQQIPSERPWFPQSWCNNAHILCSAGQQPSDSGKTYDELLQECEQQHADATAYCDKNETEMAPRMVEVCYSRADRASLACRERAKRITGSGQYPVP
jgi:hypothetical protein